MKKLVVLSLAMVAASSGLYAQTKKAAPASKSTTVKKGETAANNSQGGAVDADGFKTLPNGLKYKLVKDAPGASPNVGDFITIHTYTHVGDSMLFKSRDVNNNEPFEIQVRPPQQPRFDLMDGFMAMSAGDSAVFRVPLDTMLEMGAPALPWMKKGAGQILQYEVVMTKVKPQAEAFKEKASKAKAQMEQDDKLLADYFAKNNIKAIKHPSGLYYTVSKNGVGDTARAGQTVSVNYTGKTMDGNKFDSNVDSAFGHVQPFSFALGQGQVIAGWDIGLSLMKKGSKGTLYIPSPLAYGERSPSPAIPANSILIFDVELTDIQAAKEQAPVQGHSEHDGHNH